MRISTTTLESFRLFMDPEQDWMLEQELIDTILGKFTPNHKVLIGKAFGTILETPEPYTVDGGYRCEDIFLGEAVMGPALSLIDRPRTVFEAKAIGHYGAHDVVAKADQLVGADLIETKATLGMFDFDKYATGYQWRFMADIFRPTRITYHVFCLYENAKDVIELKSVETFHLYPYADLRWDCEALVSAFVSYVDAKGLRPYLDARQVDLAGAL